MSEETMAKPSPQHPRESEHEFSRLLQGEGSPEQFVTAVKKESRSYVKGVRDGQYSVGRITHARDGRIRSADTSAAGNPSPPRDRKH
jgi:hypothetical protein